jgi:cytochrome P450
LPPSCRPLAPPVSMLCRRYERTDVSVSPPRFDAAQSAWILSRYADVLAALREPRLWPVSARSAGNPEIPDEAAQSRVRSETTAALSPTILTEWQRQIEPLASEMVTGLPVDRAVDLVSEFAEPWSLKVAAIVTGPDPATCERMVECARDVSAASADPDNAELQSRAATSKPELDRSFTQGPEKLRGPTFVALSQTLPRLLGNMWLALLQHPAELKRLQAQPDLLPSAIEELLRYAGLTQTLYRRATANIALAGVSIAEGQRVILQLAAAHRDPARFSEPDRLDITRRDSAHFTLGAGPHSCVGAPLIRMAATIATSAFVQRFSTAKLDGPVEWSGGSGFRSPASLRVIRVEGP